MQLTLKDVLKKSFLEGWSANEIGTKAVFVTLTVTIAISLYIFLVYRLVTRKTFYSNTFNISLCGTAIITAAIIITIQSNVILSLGMVGALSIVRFRTAIKDPMDLMFLFWSISIGIICGAGHAENAAILSLLLTVCIVGLNRFPLLRMPEILVVNASSVDIEKQIIETIEQHCKHYSIKSRNVSSEECVYSIEVRIKANDEESMTKALLSTEGVRSLSLIAHDGEVTF